MINKRDGIIIALVLLGTTSMFIADKNSKTKFKQQEARYTEIISEINEEKKDLVNSLCNINSDKEKLNSQISKLSKDITALNCELKKYKNKCSDLTIKAKKYEHIVGKVGGRASRGGSIPHIRETNLGITGTAYTYYESMNTPGLAASGYNLLGKDWTDRVVAIDPNFVPLNRHIYVVFEDTKYQFLNGWWKTVDTGGKIKGNRVDFYFGEGDNQQTRMMLNFGTRNAKITAIARG